jgi:hypothetical protein
LGALAAPIASLQAQGTDWPNKPIHIIVPGGPGGVTDIRARWLGERLSPVLGQPVVIENRGGAGGNLGTVAAARSPPEGYTLVIVHIGTMAINPHLYANPGYDPLVDLIPITRVGVGPQVLVVHKSVPANSGADQPGEGQAWHVAFHLAGRQNARASGLKPADAPRGNPGDPRSLQGRRAGGGGPRRRTLDVDH